MRILKRDAAEWVASVWLVIVTVQYAARYYLGDAETDYKLAYIALVIGLLALSAWRLVRTRR
ncbi:MAG: hypothetical protein ACYC2Y_06145 [Armatimonadota bacterium]